MIHRRRRFQSASPGCQRGFIINPFALGGSGGGGPLPTVTWNPSDKHANVSLTGSNLVAARGGAGPNSHASVRATLGKSSGKHYFEVVVTSGQPAPYITIGVASASEPLNNYVGSTATGYSYYEETGTKITNGAGTAYGAFYTTDDVIGVAVDMDAGKIWFSKNGVWYGNPAAGTGEAFSGLAGTLFPMVSVYYISTAHQLTGRFRAASFGYTPPAGFGPWGG